LRWLLLQKCCMICLLNGTGQAKMLAWKMSNSVEGSYEIKDQRKKISLKRSNASLFRFHFDLGFHFLCLQFCTIDPFFDESTFFNLHLIIQSFLLQPPLDHPIISSSTSTWSSNHLLLEVTSQTHKKNQTASVFFFKQRFFL